MKDSGKSKAVNLSECYRMSYKFNASHNTSGREGGEHVHTFRIVVVVRKTNNRFVDFYSYERAITDVVEKYKGKCFNDFPEFMEQKPTIENICIYLYNRLTDIFNGTDNFMLAQVEFGDSPTQSFSVSDRYMLRSINKAMTKDELLSLMWMGELIKEQRRNEQIAAEKAAKQAVV